MLLLGAACLGAAPCCAQSLWQRREESQVFLFHDTKARHVGDLLTIVVRENTDVDNKDQRALNKDISSGRTFGFSANGGALGVGPVTGDAALNASNTKQHGVDKQAEYTVERGFTDQITVTVIDTLPNGNLVVAGQRKRIVAGEERTLSISGIVRTNDIQPDNKVDSLYVANFRVVYQGQGHESRYMGQNWLERAMHRIWPY